MTAANAIAKADKFGVFLRFDGDRLALKGSARPSMSVSPRPKGTGFRSTAGRSPATGYAQTRASCHIGYRG